VIGFVASSIVWTVSSVNDMAAAESVVAVFRDGCVFLENPVDITQRGATLLLPSLDTVREVVLCKVMCQPHEINFSSLVFRLSWFVHHRRYLRPPIFIFNTWTFQVTASRQI
jgi:hypothetical protein